MSDVPESIPLWCKNIWLQADHKECDVKINDFEKKINDLEKKLEMQIEQTSYLAYIVTELANCIEHKACIKHQQLKQDEAAEFDGKSAVVPYLPPPKEKTFHGPSVKAFHGKVKTLLYCYFTKNLHTGNQNELMLEFFYLYNISKKVKESLLECCRISALFWINQNEQQLGSILEKEGNVNSYVELYLNDPILTRKMV